MINNAGGQPIEVEDSAVCIFRFDNGALGCLTSAYYIDKDKQSSLTVWGEHGWLRMRPHEGGPLEWFSDLPDYEIQPLRKTSYGEGAISGYHALVRDAVRAAGGLGKPPVTTEESLQVLRVIHAAYRSAESGTKQPILQPGSWSAGPGD